MLFRSRDHSDEESMGVVEESDAEEDESTAGLQENYNSLLEKSGEYTRVAKCEIEKGRGGLQKSSSAL